VLTQALHRPPDLHCWLLSSGFGQQTLGCAGCGLGRSICTGGWLRVSGLVLNSCSMEPQTSHCGHFWVGMLLMGVCS
jgi:hypothetical protein